MRDRLGLVDLVVELLDARIPRVSRNPAFAKLFGHKPVCMVFTKSALADATESAKWENWYKGKDKKVHFIDSLTGQGLSALVPGWRGQVEERRRRNGATTSLKRPLRIMIAGIPNIGKSTLVNRLAVGKRADVGPRPGVTRHQQWIPLEGSIELLDTPGVLWPKIASKRMELKLTACGAIKDELVGEELVSEYLLEFARHRPGCMEFGVYGLAQAPDSVDELLAAVGRQRGFLKPGGHVDLRKSAITVLRDFRNGRLGRVTLEPFEDTDA